MALEGVSDYSGGLASHSPGSDRDLLDLWERSHRSPGAVSEPDFSGRERSFTDQDGVGSSTGLPHDRASDQESSVGALRPSPGPDTLGDGRPALDPGQRLDRELASLSGQLPGLSLDPDVTHPWTQLAVWSPLLGGPSAEALDACTGLAHGHRSDANGTLVANNLSPLLAGSFAADPVLVHRQGNSSFPSQALPGFDPEVDQGPSAFHAPADVLEAPSPFAQAPASPLAAGLERLDGATNELWSTAEQGVQDRLGSLAVNPHVQSQLLETVPYAGQPIDASPGLRFDTSDGLLDASQLMQASTGRLLAAGPQQIWEEALASANQTLTRVANQANFNALIQGAFGTVGTDKALFDQRVAALQVQLAGDGLGLTVELRSNSELNGAAGAYAAMGHTGTERIYLNADWITNGASAVQIRQVLLEEAGHAIDHRLNGTLDSEGDEGALFAKRLTGEELTTDERAAISADNDSALLTIDGVQVLVEEANSANGASTTLASILEDTTNSTGNTIQNLFGSLFQSTPQTIRDETFGTNPGTWTNSRIDTTSAWGNFLGRYWYGTTSGTNNNLASTVLQLSGQPATISFDFLRIDSWDPPAESFQVLANGLTIINEPFSANIRETATRSGSTGAYTWTIVPGVFGEPGVFGKWSDQIFKVTIQVASGVSTLELGLTSSLNQANVTDESWGIDNFKVTTNENHALSGIVLTSNAATSAQGAWQWLEGSTWTDITTTLTDSAGFFLNAATSLRFLPAANFNGTPGSLTVRLADSSITAPSNGSTVNVSSNGGTTAYSAATVSLGTSITAVNDQPSPITVGAITTVNEDSANATAVSLWSSAPVYGTGGGNDESSQTLSYTITAIPSFITLFLSNGSTAVTANTTLSAADFAALKYKTLANANGTATISFDVIDSGSGTDPNVNTLASQSVSFTVNAANDAPLATGSATLLSVNEDSASPAGSTVASLFSANFSDSTDTISGGSSANSLAGIAISSYTVDALKGYWQYSANGSTWTNLLSSTNFAAVTLKATDYLRFVPAANYNGAATLLSANLIETGGSAVTTGSTVNLSGEGSQLILGTTNVIGWSSIYSDIFAADNIVDEQTGSIVADVFGDNYWLGSEGAGTGSILIDLGVPTSLSRIELFNATNSGYNDRATAQFHIEVSNAIAGTSATSYQLSNGLTVASGTLTYATVGVAPSPQSFALSSGDTAYRYVKFIADTSKNNNPALHELRLYPVSATAVGNATSYSAATVALATAITPVNDAPSIASGYTYNFTTINENTNSSATLVSTILTAASLADADSSALSGLAITSSTGNGTWQYSTDGTTWRAFGSVSASNALLLTSTSQVRYLPDGNNGETASLAYLAWDQTTGSASTNTTANYATTAVAGGSSPFSTNTSSAQIIVSAVNDAPFLDSAQSPVLATISEDAPAPANASTANSTLISDLVVGISDVDTSALKGIAITAVNSANGNLYYSTTGGSTWALVGPVSSSASLLLASNSNTRLYFQPTTNYNGTIADVLTFLAWDQSSGTNGSKVSTTSTGASTAFSSATDTVALTVSASNDAPTITVGTGNSRTASLTETNAALSTSGTLTVSDIDGIDIVTTAKSLSVSGTSSRIDPAAPSETSLLGMLSLSPTPILAAGQQTNNLSWSFNSGSDSFDYLRKGETLVLTYTITATDNGSPLLTGSNTVAITITGTNDTPVITNAPDTASLT